MFSSCISAAVFCFVGGGDQQYLDYLHDRPSPVSDVTDSEMFLFLPVVIQMGHDTQPSERQLINY
jgi:hypothetical protein